MRRGCKSNGKRISKEKEYSCGIGAYQEIPEKESLLFPQVTPSWLKLKASFN